MWIFIRHIFQLLLAPARGWEDVSALCLPAEDLQKKGLFPLIAVTALSEFFQLIYFNGPSFAEAVGNAVAIGGGLFASLYAARLFMDIVLVKFINPKINLAKVNVLVVFLIGLDCIYRIFSNFFPATLTFLALLPLFSIIIIFQSTAYIEIPENNTINYTALATVGVIVIPALICGLLLMII